MGKTGGAYRIKQTRTHRGRRHDKKVVLQQQQWNFGHRLARVLGRQGHHHGFGEQNLHVQIGRGGLRRAHNRNVQLIALQALQQNQRIGLRQLQLDVGVLLLVQPYHAAQQWMQHGCACVAQAQRAKRAIGDFLGGGYRVLQTLRYRFDRGVKRAARRG